MAYEPTEAKTWIFDTLSQNSLLMDSLPGGIWEDVAGAKATTPYIVYNVSGSSDDDAAGARVATRIMITVKVVSILGNEKAEADAALRIIDDFLQDAHFEKNGLMFRVKGAGAMPEYPELASGGLIYKHQGRFWRFTVSTI